MAFTPAQQKQIKTIIANYHKKVRTILQEHRGKVMEISGKYDQKKVDDMHERIKKI